MTKKKSIRMGGALLIPEFSELDKVENQRRLCIGIDPGVTTGISVWDPQERKFHLVTSAGICHVMEYIKLLSKKVLYENRYVYRLELYIEDARLRKWFGKEKVGNAVQGAGSIKRDCGIWEEFCEANLYHVQFIAPKNNRTKVPQESFARMTGWTGTVNEHARDAAMLVWGMK